MTLTKTQIIDTFLRLTNHKWSKSKATGVFDVLLEIIKRALENGDEVLVSNFGKFSVVERAAKKGRNPMSGDSLMISARKVVKFKSSTTLRDKINNADIKRDQIKSLRKPYEKSSYKNRHFDSLF